MKFDEAAAHVGRPVLVIEHFHNQVHTGEIVAVKPSKQLVKVRLRSNRNPAVWLERQRWYAPVYLRIPEWWHREQAVAGKVTP